jgi:hypothetical protein
MTASVLGGAGLGLPLPSAIAADPGRSIAGHVVDSEGAGIERISVIAVGSEGQRYKTSTTKTGRFSFGDLTPDQYRIRFVDTIGVYPLTEDYPMPFAPEWLGDTPTRASSPWVDVRRQSVKGVRSVLDIGAQVSGRVFVNGRAATEDDDVTIEIREAHSNASVVEAVVDGPFREQSIAKGTYEIVVRSANGAVLAKNPATGKKVFRLSGLEKVSGIRVDLRK